LIDKAKSLIAEGKFSDASSVLQQLTGLSLTSEQTKLVDGLKEQIQKALAAKAAGDAAGAAGGFLKQ
jgi:Arc/MetJ-type ribon-helix-helix transcriptional regulator